MFLMLDDLILVDEIVGLLVNGVVGLLVDGVVGLLDDGVVVNIFWKYFNLILY